MTPPSIAVIAATLLTADLGWQQQFRNAANAAVFTNVAQWTFLRVVGIPENGYSEKCPYDGDRIRLNVA